MPISGTTSATQNVPEDVDEMPSGNPGNWSIMISCCPACRSAKHRPSASLNPEQTADSCCYLVCWGPNIGWGT